jgi:hypothetical protein
MRKPRSDSTLDALAEDQKAALCDWLLCGLSYARVRTLVEKEFSISTSVSALSRFWESYCARELLMRRSRAVTMAQKVEEAVEAGSQITDEAIMAQVRELSFTLASAPGVKPAELYHLVKLLLEQKGQTLKGEDLRLKREKYEFSAAKAALEHAAALKAIAGDRSIDAQERLRRARETLFGEAPE